MSGIDKIINALPCNIVGNAISTSAKGLPKINTVSCLADQYISSGPLKLLHRAYEQIYLYLPGLSKGIKKIPDAFVKSGKNTDGIFKISNGAHKRLMAAVENSKGKFLNVNIKDLLKINFQ